MKLYSLKNLLLLTAFFGILSAGFHGFGLLNVLPINIVYSDVLAFFQKAHAPGFPYLNKAIEYPVLIGLFIQFMGYMGVARAGYFVFSSLFLILFAVLTTYFLYQLTPAENKKRLMLYWIFAPTFFLFLTYNWDILAVSFSVAALYFARKEKHAVAAFSLALGFASKFYPILYLVPLLLKIRTGYERIKVFFVFAITAFLVNIFFMWKNFSGWYFFYHLNQIRNSNPDSPWTVVRFLVGDFGIPAMNAISLLLFALGFAIVIWKMRERTFPEMNLGLTLVFLLTNKVFTPQYILWLLPFFILIPAIKKMPFYLLEFSNAAVLFAILPWFFSGHDIFYFYVSAPFIVIRHVVLIYILLLILYTKQPLPQNQKYQVTKPIK